MSQVCQTVVLKQHYFNKSQLITSKQQLVREWLGFISLCLILLKNPKATASNIANNI